MILALETATLQAGVALVDGEGRVVTHRAARVTTHSETLLGLVADVLDEASVRPLALRAIGCGAGPGSFTGLRIGLATAKGLCLATGRPLVLASSLAALALRAPAGSVAVPCIDAFKGEVYAGFFRRGVGTELTPLLPESVLAPARLAAWLAAQAAADTVCLIGDGAVRWPELALPAVDAGDRAPPDARDVARLCAARFARGETDPLAGAVPTYIRPSEAELKGAVAGLTPA